MNYIAKDLRVKSTLKIISSLFLFAACISAGGTLYAGQPSVFAKVKNTLSQVFVVSQVTEGAATSHIAVASDELRDIRAFCLPITGANTNGEIPSQSSLPPPPVKVFVARPAEEGPSECEERRSSRESVRDRQNDYEENFHPLDNNPDIEDGVIVLEIVDEDGRYTASFAEVRRNGDDGMTMLTASAGEAAGNFDPGLYDVTVIDFREQWIERRQISSLGGRTQRFRIELDTPFSTETEEAGGVALAPVPDLRDFPQADGQLCDEDGQPMGIKGTLTIQGVDHGYASTTEVQADGTFVLSGLKRGTYLLRFMDDVFYAEQVVQIPLRLIFEGRHVFEVPAASWDYQPSRAGW